MTVDRAIDRFSTHEHVFLGKDHDQAERRTWMVIALCTAMMIAEIVGGALFGSLALIADGLHMSTHAGALLLAAMAYTYARKYANDRDFTFGTGKFDDLAGYSSAIVLAMIALLIGYEAVSRFLNPVAISFNEAIPIAVLGLGVNLASAWLLSGGHHGHAHGHSHGHGHGHAHDHSEDIRRIVLAGGGSVLGSGVCRQFGRSPGGWLSRRECPALSAANRFTSVGNRRGQNGLSGDRWRHRMDPGGPVGHAGELVRWLGRALCHHGAHRNRQVHSLVARGFTF